MSNLRLKTYAVLGLVVVNIILGASYLMRLQSAHAAGSATLSPTGVQNIPVGGSVTYNISLSGNTNGGWSFSTYRSVQNVDVGFGPGLTMSIATDTGQGVACDTYTNPNTGGSRVICPGMSGSLTPGSATGFRVTFTGYTDGLDQIITLIVGDNTSALGSGTVAGQFDVHIIVGTPPPPSPTPTPLPIPTLDPQLLVVDPAQTQVLNIDPTQCNGTDPRCKAQWTVTVGNSSRNLRLADMSNGVSSSQNEQVPFSQGGCQPVLFGLRNDLWVTGEMCDINANNTYTIDLSMWNGQADNGFRWELGRVYPYPITLLDRDSNEVLAQVNVSFAFAMPSPTPTQDPGSPSGGGAGCFSPPNFAAWGLPSPQADGATGYQAFLTKINSDGVTRWAVDSMLNAERYASSKGFNVIQYLTTGWLWFENGFPFSTGPSGRPDPYSVNCNDNTSLSRVSLRCSATNYQIAGYQAAENRKTYRQSFIQLYGNSDAILQQVMNRVISDSGNASRSAWSYQSASEQGQGLMQNIGAVSSTTLNDIAVSGGALISGTDRQQFLTLIAGKDPAMVAAFNSQAVSQGDLINGLINQGCTYGYICAQYKQVLANIIQALYLYDGGCLTTPSPTVALPTIREGWLHPGIDIRPQTPNASDNYVYSTHAGFVTYAGPAPAAIREKGWLIQIESDLNRDNVPDMITRYTHLYPNSVMINDVKYKRLSYTPDFFLQMSSNNGSSALGKLPYGFGPYVARNQLLAMVGDTGSPGRRHMQYEIITNRYLSTFNIGLGIYDCRDNPYLELCAAEDFTDPSRPGFFFPINRKKPDDVRGPVYINPGFVTPLPAPPPVTPSP